MAKNVTIIGAGLAGCFMALLLAKRGIKVDVYESASKEEIINNASKRSFNLTLYGYWVQMLKEAGLWTTIKPHLLSLKGSVTQVGENTQPIYAPTDHKKMPYYTIQRSSLIAKLLIKALENPLINFHFNSELVSINRYDETIVIRNEKSKKLATIACDVIIGADGINSKTRSFVQQGQETLHSQEYATWNYKQFFISKESAEKLSLTKAAAHTWARKNAVISAFPNKEGSFNAMCILPKEEGRGFASLSSATAIENFITQNFPTLLPILSEIQASLLKNPEGYFVTIHTSPWYYKDFMVIIGDAAHGFYPFFGQGITAAFGDCMTIAKLIDQYKDDWETIFSLYQKARKKHMDALGELSKQGFIHYRRTKKADYAAVYDKLESILHAYFPSLFLPPLFVPIAIDPNHTADHLAKHIAQRKKATWLGIPLLVHTITTVVMLGELARTATERFKNYTRFKAGSAKIAFFKVR